MENPSKSEIIAGFRSLNYPLCQTYYDSNLWKTTAPPEVIYDIFKSWKKLKTEQGDGYMKNVNEGTPAHTILSREISVNPNFDVEQVKQSVKNQKLLRKYFTPTEPNWGPKARATGGKK